MSDTIAFCGGTVILPGGSVSPGMVVIEGSRITYAGPLEPERISPSAQQIDSTNLYVLPGLIDTHVHGSHGDDVMLHGEEGLRRICQRLPRYGTTAWLPTTISAKHAELLRVIRECVTVRSNTEGAEVIGIHVEGPYINLARKGAQPAEGIREPDLHETAELIAAGEGSIRLMTLAPEVTGGEELIRYLVQAGVIASLGHTDATYEQALAGIAAGATHATHLFNAMRPLHHREPGVIAACLAAPDVIVELIADGIHLHPETVRLCLRNKPMDRVVAVTDGISATGMGNGTHTLGPHRVTVTDALCTLSDGTIAGSVLTMDQAVRNLRNTAGACLERAVYMSSLVPARITGCADRKGSLEAGKDADVTLFDRELRCVATWVNGRAVFDSRPT